MPPKDSDVAVIQRQYDDLMREKIAIEIEIDNLLFSIQVKRPMVMVKLKGM